MLFGNEDEQLVPLSFFQGHEVDLHGYHQTISMFCLKYSGCVEFFSNDIKCKRRFSKSLLIPFHAFISHKSGWDESVSDLACISVNTDVFKMGPTPGAGIYTQMNSTPSFLFRCVSLQCSRWKLL